MVRIVELDHQASESLASLFNVHQYSSAAICQPVQSVDVVDQDYLTSYLQLQLILKRRISHTTSIVGVERLHYSACIFGLDFEEFSLNLVQLSVVPGVDLGIGAIDVQGFAVQGGVGLGPNSCLQHGNVLFCLSASSYSVQEVSIDFVFTLPMVFLQVDHSEEFPQVSNGMGQGMLLVGWLFKHISSFGGLELVEVAKDKDRHPAKDCVNHGDLTQAEVQIVEEVCRHHTDLIDDDAPQIPEEQPLICPLLL